MVEAKEMHGTKSKVRLFFVSVMAVFVTLLLACAAGADSPIPNLITNPGFEGTYSGGVAPNWQPISYGGASVTYSRTTSAPHSGTSCQKVRIDSLPPGAGAFIFSSPLFNITAGHTYQMSIWVRADVGKRFRKGVHARGAKIQILFRDHAAAWQLVYACKTVTANGEWQLVTFTGGPNYSSSSGQFLVTYASTGTVYLDDAAVVDTTATGQIIGGRCINPNPIPATFFGVDINHGGNFHGMPPIGVGLLRLWNSQVTWDYVQYFGPDDWGWSGVDNMFQNAGPNADIIYTIGGHGMWNEFSAPPWMTPHLINGRPDDLSSTGPFATFMRALAGRVKNYGVNRYYEVINEADCTPISPADAIVLTNTVLNAVTSQDPSAKLTAPNITTFGLPWLENWLSLGGGRKVKAMTFHRYQNAAPEVDVVLLRAMYDLMCNYNLTSAPAVKYEAENGMLGGAAAVYSDSGVSGGNAVSGIRGTQSASDTITVNASTAGIHNLRIRFSNGFAATGSVNLAINGGVDQTVYVPMTGRWTSSYAYADIWMPIGLQSGSNTLAFTSDTAHAGGLNLDYISIAPLYPLFDTEGSAGGWMPDDGQPGDPPMADNVNACGAIARRHILEWLFGVSKTAWYCWDTFFSGAWQYDNMCGTPWKLCEEGDQTPNVYGRAYGYTAAWLTGATMTDWCVVRNADGLGDDVWVVDITRPGGYSGYILWAVGPNASAGVQWTIPGVWPVDQVHDLWGNTSPFTPGEQYLLKPSPVLFD